MKSISLIILLVSSTFIGFGIENFIEHDSTFKITYRDNATWFTSSEYDGIDTSFLVVNNGFIKTYNKFDDSFHLIEIKTGKKDVYTHNNVDGKDYTFEVFDLARYKVTYLNESKTILGFKCKKAVIQSQNVKCIVYYTAELGVKYCPRGVTNGFVLEYHFRNRNGKFSRTAIKFEDEPQDTLEIPSNYVVTTSEKYNNKIDKQNTRKPLISEGKKAPACTFSDLDGNQVELKLKKGKVIVLNFWFIGCKNCLNQIPELNKLAAHFKDNPNVEFYALTGDLKSNLAKFLQKRKFDFKIVPDVNHLHSLFGIRSFPTTIIIDEFGRVSLVYTQRLDHVNIPNLIKELDKVVNGGEKS